MDTPAQIDFQGMDPQPAIHDAVARHIAQLEQRFGHITGCRVVVKGPGQHHHTGGLYEINVHLALPHSKDVDVARTPQNDERYADIHFALNDAFKRARRQLQDRARRLTIFDQEFTERRGRQRRTRRFALAFRTLSVPQMARRLEKAGFAVTALLGDYRGGPWDARADVWVLLAKKP